MVMVYGLWLYLAICLPHPIHIYRTGRSVYWRVRHAVAYLMISLVIDLMYTYKPQLKQSEKLLLQTDET